MNQKTNLSKLSSHEKRCFNMKSHLRYVSLLEEDRPWERENEKEKTRKKRKEKLIVMSCHALEKIQLSLNENQESQVQKKC